MIFNASYVLKIRMNEPQGATIVPRYIKSLREILRVSSICKTYPIIVKLVSILNFLGLTVCPCVARCCLDISFLYLPTLSSLPQLSEDVL